MATLSRGEDQRISIARALDNEPQFILGGELAAGNSSYLADEGPRLIAPLLGLHLCHAHAIRHASLLSAAVLYRPAGARATAYTSTRNCSHGVPLMLTANSQWLIAERSS